MVIAAVIGLCVLLVVFAFLFPRLSRGPEREGEEAMGAGSRGASKVPGKAGEVLAKPFQKSSDAISKSAGAGRRGRSKVS